MLVVRVTDDVGDDPRAFRAQVRTIARELTARARRDHAAFAEFVANEGRCPAE